MPPVPSKPVHSPIHIGWRERVSLPDLGIGEFTAKMDTGALYCVLHATHIRIGRDTVSFRYDDGTEVVARLAGRKRITSSNGDTSVRPLILTRVKIGRKTIRAAVTLIDRSKMRDKMLLGRKLLRRRFIIDPTMSYALSSASKKREPS